MKQVLATVGSNQKISQEFLEMSFPWDSSAADIPAPGQFLTIRVTHDSVPLLRRPFAFSGYDAPSRTARIIYQKRGRATDLLATREPGETVDIIGPLGRPFPMPAAGSTPLLVAGGIGLGPILFLSSILRADGVKPELVFGCRTADAVPVCESFSAEQPAICTDDGSAGFAGTTVDYLRSRGSALSSGATLYACGPAPMLRGCHEFARSASIPCYVSVEQVMACGVGACMGCVVHVNGGYARACKEGPVFDSTDIVWD